MTDGDDHAFQRLCHEAALACGTDMPAIERYVFARIDKMGEAERARAKRDLQRVLSYRPPQRRSGQPHQ